MKQILLLISLLIVSSLNLEGQTIHSFIFADVEDPVIGEGNRKNVDNMRDFVNYVSKISGMKVSNDTPKILTGTDFNSDSLDAILDNLKCDFKDIIIFYYSGHGGRAINDKSKLPQIIFNDKDPEVFHPIEQIWYKLIDKGTHFVLVLCESGNMASDMFVMHEVPLFDVASLVKNLQKSIYPPQGLSYASSLFYQKAYVLASACQENENAYITPQGGLFTNAFLSKFYDFVNSTTDRDSINWDTFSKHVTIDNMKQKAVFNIISAKVK